MTNEMYMIKISRFFILFLFALFTAVSADALETQWYLVADGTERMPMDSVICLVTSDDSDRMTVVGTERTITGVARVWFEASEENTLPILQQSHITVNIISANNTLTINGLTTDTDMRIYANDGRRVCAHHLKATDGPTTIFIGNLPSGIYIASILNRSFKFIKN